MEQLVGVIYEDDGNSVRLIIIYPPAAALPRLILINDGGRGWRARKPLSPRLPLPSPWHRHPLISGPSQPPPLPFLTKHTLRVCPPIGRGKLQGSEVVRAQRQ